MLSTASSNELPIPTPMELDNIGTVIFELPAERLASLVGVLRRLSKQPVRFRFCPTPDDEPGRVLVRAASPPRLVIERAIDDSSSNQSMPRAIAYLEHSDGVWVQIGFQNSRPESHQPEAGNLVLLKGNGDVETVADGEFTTELSELALAEIPNRYFGSAHKSKFQTPLRLVHYESTESPRLWVIRDDALGQLTKFCRATHQQLLTRFTLAVSASAGVPCVVLRATTSKGPPPLFTGSAVAYRPLQKLQNVYIPAGFRLRPDARRDVLSSLLAPHSDRIVWLHPLDNRAFQLESIQESAFRPLAEWVDYRLETTESELPPWTQSHRWELESFVERPDRVAPPSVRPRPTGASETKNARPARGLLIRALDWLKQMRHERGAKQIPQAAEPSVPVDTAMKTALNQGHRLHLARPEIASGALDRCRTLEARFLAGVSKNEIHAHDDLWPELAAAYDAAGNHADAALCWLNALWGPTKPNPLLAWGWLRAEARAARPEVKTIDPVPWLAAAAGPGTTRALAAWVVWASVQQPVPAILSQRTAELQSRLERFEHWLPIRSAWLARISLARSTGADALALARTRDRLAERLQSSGPSLELDTPSFLRFAGAGMRERFHEVRQWLGKRRDLIQQWISNLPSQRGDSAMADAGIDVLHHVGLEANVAHTRAYADLILAWGLTRLAEYNWADTIRKQAESALPTDDPVHGILRDAFQFRIAQLRDAKSVRGSLSDEILSRIELATGLERYSIDKLREHSRILEPAAQISSYESEVRGKSEATPSPHARIAQMPGERLNEEIVSILDRELATYNRPRAAEMFRATLDRAVELSDEAMSAVFERTPQALDAAREDAPYCRLLASAFVAASLWDRADVARELTNRLLRLTQNHVLSESTEGVVESASRCLRKLGLKDADMVLHEIAARIVRGQPIGRLRVNESAAWPAKLRMLLQCAAGWYLAGNDDDAHAILDEASHDMFAARTPASVRTKLAVRYVKTLAYAPLSVALGRLEQIFQDLRGIELTGSTNKYYSLNPLMLIETTVRAVVSDEFTIGPLVRAWLDADELSIRRRIRDDLKIVLMNQGL